MRELDEKTAHQDAGYALSEVLAALAGAENAEHKHATGGVVLARVWLEPVQHTVTALAGEFPDAGVRAECEQARMLTKPPYRGANGGEFASRGGA